MKIRLLIPVIFGLVFATAIIIPSCTKKIQATYYVSPSGSDSNNGLNPSTPFLTITRAQNVVRTINMNMTGDIFVYLRGGPSDNQLHLFLMAVIKEPTGITFITGHL